MEASQTAPPPSQTRRRYMNVDIMIEPDPGTAGPGLVQGQGNAAHSSMNKHSVTTSKMNVADVKGKAMTAQRNMLQGSMHCTSQDLDRTVLQHITVICGLHTDTCFRRHSHRVVQMECLGIGLKQNHSSQQGPCPHEYTVDRTHGGPASPAGAIVEAQQPTAPSVQPQAQGPVADPRAQELHGVGVAARHDPACQHSDSAWGVHH